MTLVLALASAPASTAVEPLSSEAEREIVVIGQKLASWSGALKQGKTTTVCKTRKSTGDRAIDKIGCDAMLQCFPPHHDHIKTIYRENRNKAARERLMVPVNNALATCVREKRGEGIAELADRRVAEGAKR